MTLGFFRLSGGGSRVGLPRMTLNYVIQVGILDLILPTRGDSGLLVKRKVDFKTWNSAQESEARSCACAQSHGPNRPIPITRGTPPTWAAPF